MKRIKLNPVDVFDIQNLPDVPFRRVLYFLSVKDTRNLRCLSKWFEKRITFLRKSIFNKFYLKGYNNKITEDNCKEISLVLSVAKAKLNSPEKLEMEFLGKLNQTMRKITVDYKDIITFMDIDVGHNEDLLLQPSFHFKCLESLKLSCDSSCSDNIVKACEAMLHKHANNLNSLKLEDFSKNLRVPDLPKLDSLILRRVTEEAAWNVLEKCRPTITSLVIDDTKMESPPFNNDDSNKTEVYQIPNLKHLSIMKTNAFKFIICNADNLVSLDIKYTFCFLGDAAWPQFLNLRELSIFGSYCLPILMKCRATLERLVLRSIFDNDDRHSCLIMPRLTDLYLIDVNPGFTNKICSSIHTGLDFLFLSILDLSNLDDGIQMESMRNVVLGVDFPSYTAQDRERMTVMCPNAEVISLNEENKGEIRDLVRYRSKQRNFSLDLQDYLLIYY